MTWTVSYTVDAEKDLIDIYDYIADILHSPSSAKKQTERIMDSINDLEYMPLRHKLYEHEPWHTKGLRVLSIDNYLAFYLPDESRKTVMIIRIMYNRRDTKKHLR